jgi:hypothetical protein
MSKDSYAEGRLKLSEAHRSFEASRSEVLAVEKLRNGETKRCENCGKAYSRSNRKGL